MGGRGSTSGLVTTQSLDEYLGRRGLSSPISDFMDDKLRIPHGMTQRQSERMQREATQARNEYADRRNAAIQEYNRLVESGKIRKPTRIDELLKTARGHSDNDRTQAARRSLDKRGIDWRTGRKKRSR